MFSEKSRYRKTPVMKTVTEGGREVQALTPRVLPTTASHPETVKTNDRLDLTAYQKCNDPLGFWRIADANTELDAFELIAEPGENIQIPEK